MPVDNAGNGAGLARSIGALGATTMTFADWVGVTDTDDYYSFSLSSTGSLRLNLTGMSGDADLYVYSANGTTLLGRSSNVGTTDESVSISTLAAGTYYARVISFGGDTNYSLSLAAPTQADLAGNTVAAARNIGILGTTTQTFTDWVGSADSNDYYRFTLNSVGNLQLALTGMTADADVLVYAANGTTVIGEGYNDGNVNEAISINNLAAGSYYVQVLPFSSSTNYRLSMTALAASPVVPPDSAGNTVDTARNLGVLTTTQTFKDWVGSGDINDYYRFTLSTTSDLRLNLTRLTANADVSVYDANGTSVLGTSVNTGVTSDAISINNLMAGTYYARVLPSGGNTNYNLSLAATASILADFAGNTVATARNLGILAENTATFADWVGGTDSNDYYRFTLNNTSSLQLSLTGMSVDVDVEVYAADGTTILGSSYNAGNAAEAINLNNMAAGTYYVLVNSFDGDKTNYSLALSAPLVVMPDFAGNTTTTARDLGDVYNTNQTFRDSIGGVDSNDYYCFTLSTDNSLRLNLTGLRADANVTLYASNGTTVLGTGANTGVASETITINNLTAGTYYARVYPGVTSANTNYSLNLMAIPDAAGNTVATARNIGSLSTSQTFTDWISSADNNDYYQFNTDSHGSNLRINLTGLGANADVVVYGSDGTTVLGRSANAGVTSEALAINNLTAGTYYARVYPGVTTANTNYNLAISAMPPADGVGNTISTARNLGVLNP